MLHPIAPDKKKLREIYLRNIDPDTMEKINANISQMSEEDRRRIAEEIDRRAAGVKTFEPVRGMMGVSPPPTGVELKTEQVAEELGAMGQAPIFKKAREQAAAVVEEGFVQPVSTFLSGIYEAAGTQTYAMHGGTKALDWTGLGRSDELLRAAQHYYDLSRRFEERGIKKGIMRDVYKGLGAAAFDIPFIMASGGLIPYMTLKSGGLAVAEDQPATKAMLAGGIEGTMMHFTLGMSRYMPRGLAETFTGTALSAPLFIEELKKPESERDFSDAAANFFVMGGLSLMGQKISTRDFILNLINDYKRGESAFTKTLHGMGVAKDVAKDFYDYTRSAVDVGDTMRRAAEGLREMQREVRADLGKEITPREFKTKYGGPEIEPVSPRALDIALDRPAEMDRAQKEEFLRRLNEAVEALPEEDRDPTLPRVERGDPRSLNVDAKVFQFKTFGEGGQAADVDPETGASRSWLKSRKWNQKFSGPITVWEDTSGKLWVVDGHHRLALALRDKATSIEWRRYREADGVTKEDAVAMSGLSNIARGRGHPIDFAKVFRHQKWTEEELAFMGISPEQASVKDGLALANLEDGIFNDVVTGKVPLKRAVVIGRELADSHVNQRAALDLMNRKKNLTTEVFEKLIRQVKGSEEYKEKSQQPVLFGDDMITKTHAIERAHISAYLEKQIRSTRALFKALSAEGKAKLAEDAGNILNRDINVEEANLADIALEVFKKTEDYQGTPINNIIRKYAAEMAEAKGPDKAKAKGRAYAELKQLIKEGGFFEVKQKAKTETVPELPGGGGEAGAEEAEGKEGVEGETGPSIFGYPVEPKPPVSAVAETELGMPAERKPEMKQGELLKVPPSVRPKGPQKEFKPSKEQRDIFDKTIEEEEAVRKAQQHLFDQEGVGPTEKKKLEALQEHEREKGSYYGFPEAEAPTVGAKKTTAQKKKVRAEIVTKSQIVDRIKEAFGVPVRTGRFRGLWRGIYKVRPKVIRWKTWGDMETLYHEVGHHMSDLLTLKVKLPKPVRDELVKMGKDLYGEKKPAGGYAEEGVAQYIRFYIDSPERLEKDAPLFNMLFEGAIRNYPEVRALLLDTRSDWAKWKAMPDVMKARSMISVGEKDVKEPITFNRVYSWAIDGVDAVKVIRDEIFGKRARRAMKDDAYSLMRLMRGWTGIMDSFLERGTLDFENHDIVSEPLDRIFKPLEERGQLEDFMTYATSRFGADLEARGIETGLERDVWRNSYRELESKNPNFVEAHERYMKWLNTGPDYMADSGLISRETAELWKTINANYVPFARVMSEELPGTRGPGGRTYADLFSPIKRRKGSGKPIINPLETSIKNMYAMINVAERNRVCGALARWSREEGAGYWIERVPVEMAPKFVELERVIQELKKMGIDVEPEGVQGVLEIFGPKFFAPAPNHITYVNEGVREYYRVHPELYRAVKALDYEDVHMLTKLLSAPAKTLRLGATSLSPEFALVRNPFKDQFVAFIQSEYGYKPFIYVPRAIFHMLNKDDMYWKWATSGGQHAMLTSVDRKSIQKELQDIVRKGLWNNFKDAVRHPVETFRIYGELTEAATRLGEFELGYKHERSRGASEMEARRRAALASREVTIDFGRIGAKMKSWNLMSAFMNAQLQGYDKMFQTMKKHPARTSARILISTTLPSVLLAIAQADDPRYQALSRKEKLLFFNLFPWWDKEAGPYRVPKWFSYAQVFGTIPELIVDQIMQEDPHAADDILYTLGKQFEFNMIPTAALPWLENYANWSMYYDRPIVQRGKEGLAPEYQYGPHTSETAKALSKFMKMLPTKTSYPPAKIDNLIYGYGGGAARYAVNILDAIIQPSDMPPDPEPTLADTPLVRAFIGRYPSLDNKYVDRFYRYVEKHNEIRRTARTKNEIEGVESARSYILDKENKSILLANSVISPALRVINEQRDVMDDIYNSRTMDPKTKRRELDKHTRLITLTAKMALERIYELEEPGEEE